MEKTSAPRPAPLWRRLAAVLYDTLLLFAVLYLAAIPPLLFNRGTPVAVGNHLFQMYLATVTFLFFGWFWTHGGQTLGLRAWRLRVQTTDGKAISWKQALVRYLAAALSWAALGAGFLWALVDPERRTWHDRISGTILLHCPKITDR